MNHITIKLIVFIIILSLGACTQNSLPQKTQKQQSLNDIVPANKSLTKPRKLVIYQVFTRLFGNRNNTNKPWGTIEENGVGKFNDFTDKALKAIKELGVSHIWFTGVPHHAVIRDYTQFGISNDDPDVVKGRAGSPYAIKDYYNVNPDLAVDPANRLQEFKALMDRTHNQGMKVIIDLVPNHVARRYHSVSKPKGVRDFGADDDVSVEYKRDNNFYYILNEHFKVPKGNNEYKPLNGEKQPLSDNQFDEFPAKWTGNGSRKSQPDINDWYETVKINYGVKPDGKHDFVSLPKSYADKSYAEHFEFWKRKSVPDSWRKFRDIVIYWIDLGVDGFRYDTAELVPVEFWSYLNSAIKIKKPDAVLIAEVYNRKTYRNYIHLGKMDYLYDKVDLYDTLKGIMKNQLPTSNLLPIMDKFSDIDQYLLRFLENHDEQRIASPEFSGDAKNGKPAMVISALMGKGATMLYFGQALGETGSGDAGFGGSSRTTIFDYWGVPSIQRWMNNGKFDGGKSFSHEKKLRHFYVSLLSFSASSSALTGHYRPVHKINLESSKNYNEQLFSFVRWDETQKLIVVSNFSSSSSADFDLKLPLDLVSQWQLKKHEYRLQDVLSSDNFILKLNEKTASVRLHLAPLESRVLEFQR